MSDLISRSALIKKIRDYADEVGCVRGEYELANGILKAISVVEEAQTVEAKPVVHGEWEIGGISGIIIGNFKCSVCNGVSLKDSNFCPNCGADMRGGKNG